MWPLLTCQYGCESSCCGSKSHPSLVAEPHMPETSSQHSSCLLAQRMLGSCCNLHLHPHALCMRDQVGVVQGAIITDWMHGLSGVLRTHSLPVPDELVWAGEAVPTIPTLLSLRSHLRSPGRYHPPHERNSSLCCGQRNASH